MNETLTVCNKIIPDSNIDLIQYPDTYPSLRAADGLAFYSNILRSADALANVYYIQDNLFARLQSEDPEVPLSLLFSDIVNITTFFKFQNTETNPEAILNNFYVKSMDRSMISMCGYSSEVDVSNDSFNEIRAFFDASGISMPRYGVLQFSILLSDGSNKTYACKVCIDPVYTASSPAPSGSLDSTFTTPGYTFESLFVPELSASFVYNFFETNEEDEDLAKIKNYNQFSLNEIPRFIKLNWDAAPKNREPETSATRVGGLTISGGEASTSTSPDSTGSGRGFDLVGHYTGPDPTAGASSTTSDGAHTLLVSDSPIIPTLIPASIALNASRTGYVGYVIVKEKLEQDTGDYINSDVFVINDINKTQLYDWKIGYGETYRYKIRTLYKFVDKDGISIYEDSNSVLSRQQELDIFGTSSINSFLYFFDSEFSLPAIINCIDDVRPDCPFNVDIFPNSKNKTILITWNQKNQNLDVLGFNIYKKELASKNIFAKCNGKLLNIRENFYIDNDVEVDKEYIYSIESVDVHGNFSTLSLQLIAKITNFDIDIGRNEERVKFYAYFGYELNDKVLEEKNNKYTYFKNRFKVKINPAFTEEASNAKFILRILSLDTLITKEIKMKFKLTSIYKRIKIQALASDRIDAVGGRDASTLAPAGARDATSGGAGLSGVGRAGAGTVGTG